MKRQGVSRVEGVDLRQRQRANLVAADRDVAAEVRNAFSKRYRRDAAQMRAAEFTEVRMARRAKAAEVGGGNGRRRLIQGELRAGAGGLLKRQNAIVRIRSNDNQRIALPRGQRRRF